MRAKMTQIPLFDSCPSDDSARRASPAQRKGRGLTLDFQMTFDDFIRAPWSLCDSIAQHSTVRSVYLADIHFTIVWL